ncbi:MAG TPA: COX15/CtaA family protein [Longimicrobiales bacterium]|nr:COX15/CtaA family protein [Longimicrobiales bacterium]
MTNPTATEHGRTSTTLTGADDPGNAGAGSGGDWRLDLTEPKRRRVRAWLWSIAATTFAVLVVGGITRLTQSGLSIVSWDPIMGVIPPLTVADWQHAFDQYRQFPEYQTLRQGMTLSEFQFIYFWEYLHRLLARGIGVVFLVPFLFFWVRGYLNGPLLRRSLLLFGLGAAQGVMGWLMVASGLVDRPSVSHYRLAAHLTLAFLIFGWALWLARDLAARADGPAPPPAQRRPLRRGLALAGGLLGVQIVWGAFVAGLDAGAYYPTFPLMGGRWVPAELLWLDSALENFVANPIAVQWTHRVLGTVLAVAVLGLAAVVWRRVQDQRSRQFAVALAGLIVFQYLLGVTTLLLQVPVSLGVAHQATAMVLFGVWLAWLHHAVGRSRSAARPSG